MATKAPYVFVWIFLFSWFPWNLLLGGHFGPEKKYLAPPPPKKNPQFAADTLPAPRPLLENPPPLLGFSIKILTPAPLPAALDSPRAEKKIKKYPKRPPSLLPPKRLSRTKVLCFSFQKAKCKHQIGLKATWHLYIVLSPRKKLLAKIEGLVGSFRKISWKMVLLCHK